MRQQKKNIFKIYTNCTLELNEYTVRSPQHIQSSLILRKQIQILSKYFDGHAHTYIS